MLAFFLLSHPRVFSAHDLVKLPPFRNSYPGSHGTHSSPFPTTVLAFVLVSKKKKYRDCLRFSRKNIYIYSELGFLPWRPLASNWCAFMQPTSIIRSTQALSAVSSYTDAFVSGFDLDPNEHIRHFSLKSTCGVYIHVTSSHDIRIKISRTYSRYWYRYFAKISHNISRIILGTIPDTTSKKFRTHTIWEYASLPPCWLFAAYTSKYCCTYLGFPTNSISSRPN